MGVFEAKLKGKCARLVAPQGSLTQDAAARKRVIPQTQIYSFQIPPNAGKAFFGDKSVGPPFSKSRSAHPFGERVLNLQIVAAHFCSRPTSSCSVFIRFRIFNSK